MIQFDEHQPSGPFIFQQDSGADLLLVSGSVFWFFFLGGGLWRGIHGIASLKLTASLHLKHWGWFRWVSFWEGLLASAMLVFLLFLLSRREGSTVNAWHRSIRRGGKQFVRTCSGYKWEIIYRWIFQFLLVDFCLPKSSRDHAILTNTCFFQHQWFNQPTLNGQRNIPLFPSPKHVFFSQGEALGSFNTDKNMLVFFVEKKHVKLAFPIGIQSLSENGNGT